MSDVAREGVDEARWWIQSSEAELAMIDEIRRTPRTTSRVVCFLAHLAVEKALKGVLIDAGAPFRPIHDLVELHRTCARFGRPLPINEDALLALNPWVIRGRYGGELSEDDQALVSRLTSFAHEVVSIAKVNLQHDVVLNHGDGRAAGRTSGRGCDGDHHARTRSTGPGMPRSFGVRAPVHALRVEGQGSS